MTGMHVWILHRDYRKKTHLLKSLPEYRRYCQDSGISWELSEAELKPAVEIFVPQSRGKGLLPEPLKNG